MIFLEPGFGGALFFS